MQLRLRRIPVDMDAPNAPILEAPVVVMVTSGAEDPTLAVLEYETAAGVWIAVPLV